MLLMLLLALIFLLIGIVIGMVMMSLMRCEDMADEKAMRMMEAIHDDDDIT